MDSVGFSDLDLQDNLDCLKDALTIHFRNIRDSESCLRRDHAIDLKDHIDHVRTGGPRRTEESPSQIAVLPLAVSRSAPQATFNPASNWGLLGKLPKELRDIIYMDVLFHNCSNYLQACSCTKKDRRSKSGIALLRTCGRIYNETVPLLYESEVFGISLGYKVHFDGAHEIFGWVDPVFYRQTTFGRQTIARLPHNILCLIQNLEVNFSDEAMIWTSKLALSFSDITDRLLSYIEQICSILEDCVQLHSLDMNLCFCCKLGDIDYMTRLLEPIKKLRGIRSPNIVVCGYEITYLAKRGPTMAEFLHEPRWGLTDEFTEYLEQLIMSPHGNTALLTDEPDIFNDDHEVEEEEEECQHLIERDENFIRRYLRDVYGTNDIEALHGGMPERWQVWLNSDHDKGCDWFDEEAL